MKSLPWIFILCVSICLKTNIVSAFSMINNVIIDDGENIRSKQDFHLGYTKDLLAVGNLKSNQIQKMKPHLAAATEILSDNPLKTYFEYLLAFCTDYPKLYKLNAITKNIYNFVAASKGTSRGPSGSLTGLVFFGDYSSRLGNRKVFLATSIRTDNEDDIESEFEEHDEKMRKAAEIRDKAWARAAKLQEQAFKRAARIQKEAFGTAETSLAMAARMRAKAAKELENMLFKVPKIPNMWSFSEAPTKTTKKPTRSSNIANIFSGTDSMEDDDMSYESSDDDETGYESTDYIYRLSGNITFQHAADDSS